MSTFQYCNMPISQNPNIPKSQYFHLPICQCANMLIWILLIANILLYLQNAGPMDRSDWGQGPSWRVWDWQLAKTQWHRAACQVRSILMDWSKICLLGSVVMVRSFCWINFKFSQAAWSSGHDWWWSNWLEGDTSLDILFVSSNNWWILLSSSPWTLRRQTN